MTFEGRLNPGELTALDTRLAGPICLEAQYCR